MMTNRKSHTRFPWAITHSLSKYVRLSEHTTRIWIKVDCQRRRYSAMTLDSGNIRFMRIFAVVLKIYVKFSDFMPTPVYYVYTYLTLFSLSCPIVIVYYSYLPMAAAASVKCGLAKMCQGKRINEMWSSEYLESAEKLRIFRRRSSSES